MDNKVSQYQRAVTPTIDGGGSSVVRGKILSYSNQPNSNNNSTVLSRNARPTSVGPTAAAMGYRGGTGMGSMVSPRSSSGQAVDITIQGKNTTSATTPSTSSNTQPTNNNNNNNGGIAAGRTVLNPPIPASMMNSSLLDQFNNISFLPRYDLVPLSEDIPADGIIFAKNKNQHDSLVIFRTPEERMRNPERLNLDRRQLEQCPMLEQEQRLRLLNYQNNAIKYISNVENLPNLIFLDLYNNQIMSLEGPLSSVRGLRVLMAGKNKIQKIQNLQHLKKLDVLDLHSNEIKVIEGLDGLTDLRVLNLAGELFFFFFLFKTSLF